MSHFKCSFAVVLIAACVIGCGSGKKRNEDFFTSGSREADQRADQRMAKENQLRGDGNGAGERDPDGKKPLYDRIGGHDGIEAIVEDFVTRVMADPRVNFERKGVKQGGISLSRGKSVEWTPNADNVKKLRFHISEFLALATGGPSQYHGREMKEVHTGMHITNAEFDATVGDLKATLDKMKVGNQEQKELLSIIESTRVQVVEER